MYSAVATLHQFVILNAKLATGIESYCRLLETISNIPLTEGIEKIALWITKSVGLDCFIQTT